MNTAADSLQAGIQKIIMKNNLKYRNSIRAAKLIAGSSAMILCLPEFVEVLLAGETGPLFLGFLIMIPSMLLIVSTLCDINGIGLFRGEKIKKLVHAIGKLCMLLYIAMALLIIGSGSPGDTVLCLASAFVAFLLLVPDNYQLMRFKARRSAAKAKFIFICLELIAGLIATVVYVISTMRVFLAGDMLSAVISAALTFLCIRFEIAVVCELIHHKARRESHKPPPSGTRHEYIAVECPGCGASAALIPGSTVICQYCGREIDSASTCHPVNKVL